MKSAQASKQMAQSVRWATDVYMGFLDTRVNYTQSAARHGLSKLTDARNRLLANTSELDRSIQLNDSDRDVNFRNARILQILQDLFKALIDHHEGVRDSRTGVAEVLLLAEESDFVNRHKHNYITLHKKFAIDEGHDLPIDHRLGGIAMAIGKQIKQRGHQMALEYAIKIVAPVIPQLAYAVLEMLPLH
jgi:hypothetical protein